MIRNWSIRNRVLLLALLPVISLGVVLTAYFIHARVATLKVSQSALGNTVASQLASSSLYGVLTHNPQVLQNLAESVAQEENIESVVIEDNAGHILAEINAPSPPARGLVGDIARSIGAETGFEGSLTFTRPIVQNSLPPASVLTAAPNAAVAQTGGTAIGKVTIRLSEVQFAERQAAIIVNGGLILLVCLALSILLALIISSSVVTPIGRVITMVRRFSGGEHAVRVPERSGGELGQLEQGINHMAANAQRSQHELQDQVDQATTELRGTLEEFEIKSVELDLARKRALEASRTKTEFLANMSHEIRTPMNAVLGFSDLLTRTPLNDSQRDYLATIRQSAHILLMLLDNILTAARLEMGEAELHSNSFTLRGLLEDTTQIHAMEAYAKHLELVLHSDGNDTQALLGDRAKLTRILGNLVTNAIKFTDAGTIVIHARSTHQDSGEVLVDIVISDTGIGIREQDQQRLFQPFFQVDSSSGRQQGGAGLGLYITKKLVEQLGGSLTLTSALGHGSEFHVTLRLSRDAAAAGPLVSADHPPGNNSLLMYESNPQAAEALQARLERLGWRPHRVSKPAQLRQLLQPSQSAPAYAAVILSLSYSELQQPDDLGGLFAETMAGLPVLALVNSINAEVHADIARQISGLCLPKSLSEIRLGESLMRLIAGESAATNPDTGTVIQSLHGLTIVVADDNRINRLLERILLEKYGARVLEAKSGRELLNLVTANPVDLILLDMQMPDENGWQVARRLKSDLSLAIPVIALSAMQADKSPQALSEAGLSDWLMKPLDEATLSDAIGRFTGANSALSGTGQVADAETTLSALRPALRQMLAEDLPTQWQMIEQAWQRRDFSQLQQQVHKLNGTAAFCQLTNLRTLCTQLENRLRAQREAGVSALVAQIGMEITALMQRLESPELSSVLPP